MSAYDDAEFERLFPDKPSLSRVQSMIRNLEKNSPDYKYKSKRDSIDFDEMFKDDFNDSINADFHELFFDGTGSTNKIPDPVYSITDPVTRNLKHKVDTLNKSALGNLGEINNLQKLLKLCQEEVAAEKVNRHNLDQIIQQLNEQVRRTNALIDAKDKEIGGLNTILRQVKMSKKNDHSERQHVDANELTSRKQHLVKKIQEIQETYESSGAVGNVDDTIYEIRALFDLFMVQLNEFNSKNVSVTRTLHALTDLDKAEVMMREIMKNFQD